MFTHPKVGWGFDCTGAARFLGRGGRASHSIADYLGAHAGKETRGRSHFRVAKDRAFERSQEIETVLVENDVAPDAEARIVARLSDGSLSTALDLAEQDVVEYREESLDYLRKIGTREPAEILAVAEGLAAARDRDQVRRFVRLALLWFRDLLLVKYGAREEDVANGDMMDALKEEAGRVELFDLRKRIV